MGYWYTSTHCFEIMGIGSKWGVRGIHGCNRMVVFLPAVRVSRLLAAARVLEDAVAVVEQVVSKDRGASGSSCSNMGRHFGFLGVPGDVVSGNGGAGVVTRVVITAVPICRCVAAAVLLFKSPSV